MKDSLELEALGAASAAAPDAAPAIRLRPDLSAVRPVPVNVPPGRLIKAHKPHFSPGSLNRFCPCESVGQHGPSAAMDKSVTFCAMFMTV